MKKEFIGYYNPTESEINESWTKGTFAFDANTLLNLYRYTESTRKDFLSALKTIKEKLFLPYQAGREFLSNRISVIEGIDEAYSNLYEVIKDNFNKNLDPQLNKFKKHPSIIIDNISKLHSEFLKRVSAELEKQKKEHPDFKSKDEILEELTELFENYTGKEFSKEDLKKIFVEGKERYDEKIPPGFEDLDDKQKKGERHIYGDLIIWKELINYSKKEKKPLIFITDDRKKDWWTIENGKTIRPREELIKEFFDLTGIRILIYNADSFLRYAKEKKLVPKLEDKTIKEVKEIRISDEKSYLNFYLEQLIKPQAFEIKPLAAFDYSTQPFQIKPLAAFDNLTNSSLQINPFAAPDFLKNQPIQINPLVDPSHLSNELFQNKSLTPPIILNNQPFQVNSSSIDTDIKITREEKRKSDNKNADGK